MAKVISRDRITQREIDAVIREVPDGLDPDGWRAVVLWYAEACDACRYHLVAASERERTRKWLIGLCRPEREIPIYSCAVEAARWEQLEHKPQIVCQQDWEDE